MMRHSTTSEASLQDEVRKAVVALNYCAVSITHVVAYRDRMVLDQEYDCILNNLNLEHMVKDDDLRRLFNSLLDTLDVSSTA